MDREEPKVGEVWKHFKNKYYSILCVGHHSETGERMVVYHVIDDVHNVDVYQALITTFDWLSHHEAYIRPLDMFMSEVDHEKYPNVKQKYRFEKVDTSVFSSPDTEPVS